MWTPRAFVPQATQYFLLAVMPGPAVRGGGMETVSITIASVTRWDTYPGLVCVHACASCGVWGTHALPCGPLGVRGTWLSLTSVRMGRRKRRGDLPLNAQLSTIVHTGTHLYTLTVCVYRCVQVFT